MKIRPLPDIDLARIAPLPRDQKIRALEKMKAGRPPYSYDSVRKSALELLNVDAGPLGVVGRASWTELSAAISRRCHSPEETKANLGVAKALFDFAEVTHLHGRRHDFFPLSIGLSEKVKFWLPAVGALDDQAVVPFIDPRQSKKLTAEGRRFAFSVMHERIRAADEDFADVEFAIFQLDANDDGSRTTRLHLSRGVDLYSFDDLDLMVRETYDLWRAILEERERETRRKGAGGRGSLI
ncbi:type VI toxin-antitoxin system SocB family DNA replication inhibitor toxin [Mesorhizobium sp. BHbdii]